MSATWQVTVDCASPARLATFWAAALGYEPAAAPEGFDSWTDWLVANDVPQHEWDDVAAIADPAGRAPRIGFLRVPEAKTVKNRLHLDILAGGGRHRPYEERWAAVRAEVQRLEALGARVIAEVGAGRPDHVVMADPEGNEFCVV